MSRLVAKRTFTLRDYARLTRRLGAAKRRKTVAVQPIIMGFYQFR